MPGPGRPFKPGGCPNPGGRPKGLAEAVRGQVTPLALVKLLMHVAFDTPQQQRAMFGRAATIKERVDAASELADRGWGKSIQAIDVGQNPDRQPIKLVVIRNGHD